MNSKLQSKVAAAPAFWGELAALLDTSEAQREIYTAIGAGGRDANLAFNESVTVFLEGALDEDCLRRALALLVQRHDALRSTFNRHGTQFIVHRALAPHYRRVDAGAEADPAAALARERLAAVAEPFDLIYGPLLRVTLVRLAADSHALVIASHHLVCDGWSMAILLEDLSEFYSALVERRPPRVEAGEGYLDYLRHLQSDDYRQLAAADEQHWLERFRQSQPALELPADRPRPPLRTFAADRRDRLLDGALLAAVKQLGAANRSSLVVTLFAAYAALLHRLTGQRELVIGMPAAGQAVDARERLVGHCVNTLPIRCAIDPAQSFLENLGAVRECLLASYDHQRLTFGSLVARLGMARDPARIPLMPVLYNIDTGIEHMRFSGLRAHHHSNPRIGESFELFLNAVIRADGALLECQFNTGLYRAETVERWLELLENLLRQVVADPARPLGDYRMEAAEDRARWQRFNATARDYPREASVHGLLAQAIAANGDAEVVAGEVVLSHRELDRRAGLLAAHLRDRGVRGGDFVGICLQRSEAMLVAMLAVLKAGAAYVPLDPDYPPERLQLMIDDSGLTTLLCRGAPPAGLQLTGRVVDVDDAPAGGEPWAAAVEPQAPAYVIYTSGSTGRPKGVVVPHRTIVNFLASVAREPGLAAGDTLLAVTTISFDIAVLELLLPLLVGARLVIAGRDAAKDGERLAALMRRHGVTAMQATPGTWRLLLAAGWQGGADFKVLTGGEALPQNLADELADRNRQVWNLYGPTETTVWSTVARVERGRPVTLGRPLANTRLRVVDAAGSDAALGVPGELLIGGDGVTLGYWQRPELTKERFIEQGGERYYRTGDLVRFTADGELFYLGRIDNQVKLRGYRIELGEIESRLLQLDGIAEAVAVVQEFGEADQRLVAFYRPQPDAAPVAAELREQLQRVLPAFMVPQQFAPLERFPLTPNGKVDRKALLAHKPARDAAAPAQEQPCDPAVLALFRRFLQAEVGAGDDFFESGGHSLLAMRLIAELNKQLDAQLTLTDMFATPTAAGLSQLLQGKSGGAAAIPLWPDRERFPVSLQQQRLWYQEQFGDAGIEYNLPAAWRFRGPLDRAALAAAIDTVVARHDVLRANLIEDEAGLHLRIRPPAGGVLALREAAGDDAAARLRWALADIEGCKGHAFELAAEPLFQAALYPLGDEDHLLFLLIHHSVFDGWSFDILLAELAESYNAGVAGRRPELPALPVQYGDFAGWMRARAERGDERALAFWRDHLGGALPTLELPTRGPRPPVKTHRGESVTFRVEAAPMAALAEFAQRRGATLYMALLAIYKVVLWRYSGQRDLVVGTPISGRNHAEINPLIGFFVNVLALRDRLDPDADFAAFLDRVKQTCVAAFAHQDMPFEELVRALNPARDPGRTPIFQAMLLYQNVSNRTEVFTGLDKQQITIDRAGVESDLDLWLKYDGQALVGGLDYDCDLFDAAWVEQLTTDFCALIERIPQQPERPLWQLAQLPAPALAAVLAALNATEAPVEEPALLHRLVERQAARTPAAQACWYRGVGVSYGELDARANRIAHWLDRRGVAPGSLVGVALAPGEWLQPALLGVLKHGSTYVPIDPQFPLERIRYMIDNAALALLISGGDLDPRLAEATTAPVASLAELVAELEPLPATPPAREVDPEQPAYVIYTSGSTGQPKGVMVKHRSVVNYLQSVAATPGFGADDRILAVTTLSFDIAVTELFLPLICGGASVLVDRDSASDGDLMQDVMEHAGVNVLQATPSSWRLLLAVGWNGGPAFKALCGGEALPADLIEKLLPRVGELWNMYGPTETTVWSTCQRITGVDDVGLIGTPLANTSCHVLDERLQPVPLGVPGELCIGGLGVAAGYLNRPRLTAERFVDNPFGPGRLYRTGDLARLLPNGRLLYLGRGDQQVKVRGYRIELGEIEAALAQHPAVAQAVAAVKAAPSGDHRLVAYMVYGGAGAGRPTVGELRQFLRDYLPGYMQPQHLMELAALPLTPNLKIDRKALPEPFAEVASATARLPETAMEQRLAAIWREVLGVDQVLLEDNFFDSGGHSLTAMDAIRRICQETGHRLEVREFVMETLEQLAARLERASAAAPAPKAPREPALLGRLVRRLTRREV